jgi:histone H3/H4
MAEEAKEGEEEVNEEKEGLAFANAQVVRVMRKSIAPDKMIKSEVKKAMNKFLEEIAADAAARMNKYPYAMIDLRMFEEAVEPYRTLYKVEEEKKRIVAHLEAIREDCSKLIRDVNETFKTETK